MSLDKNNTVQNVGKKKWTKTTLNLWEVEDVISVGEEVKEILPLGNITCPITILHHRTQRVQTQQF